MNLTAPINENALTAVSGIILAGGASKRMGKDKATLTWGKATIVEHIIHELIPRLAPLVVVSQKDIPLPALQESVQLVYDSIPYQGPLAGFSFGLRHVPRNQPVFLTGCDFPFLSATIIDFLHDRLNDREAAIVQINGIDQPLIGLYQPRILKVIDTLLSQGEYSLKKLLKQLDCIKVDEQQVNTLRLPAYWHMNINHPEDYVLAQQLYLQTTS